MRTTNSTAHASLTNSRRLNLSSSDRVQWREAAQHQPVPLGDHERFFAAQPVDVVADRLKVGAKHVGQAAADRDPQASGYLLARTLEGKPANRFESHSIRRGAVRTGTRCLVVPTERSPERLALFETRIAQTAREIARRKRSLSSCRR